MLGIGVPGAEDELRRGPSGLLPLPLLPLLRALPSCPPLCASAAAGSGFLICSLSRINLLSLPCKEAMLRLWLPTFGSRSHQTAFGDCKGILRVKVESPKLLAA